MENELQDNSDKIHTLSEKIKQMLSQMYDQDKHLWKDNYYSLELKYEEIIKKSKINESLQELQNKYDDLKNQ